jgi:hypothetical protein
MNYCVMCGAPIPDDQGSKTCSMCYGDPEHGKDGYYRQYLERIEESERFASEGPDPQEEGDK